MDNDYKGSDSIKYLDGLLEDYNDDIEQVIAESEVILVNIEKDNYTEDDYSQLKFLLNRIKSSSAVIGDKWISEIATMLEEISLKMFDMGDKETVIEVIGVFFEGFDGLKTYVRNMINKSVVIDEKLTEKIKTMHMALGAGRDMISQDDIDSLFD